jgi:hypothetical protein
MRVGALPVSRREIIVVHLVDGDERAICVAKGFHGSKVQWCISLRALCAPEI